MDYEINTKPNNRSSFMDNVVRVVADQSALYMSADIT